MRRASALGATGAPLMPEQFGRYQLRTLLGEGGFARVYRAYDPSLGRDVALKTLLPWRADDSDTRGRFVAEARAIAALNHRNIITIYDVGEEGGHPFFTMQLIEGRSLARLIADEGPQPLPRVIDLLRQLGAAVTFLHQKGVVHRDIKPANVMIDDDGRPVLMDFGIARSNDASVKTQTGASVGTPLYMAPEQVRGETAGPPADVYALGIVAYQLLAGRPPFAGDTAHVLHAQVYDPPPPLDTLRPDLPPHVFPALLLALAKDPALRPPADALASLLMGDSAPTQPFTPPTPEPAVTRVTQTHGEDRTAARGRPRRAGLLVATIALVVLLAAGGGLLALALHGGSSATPEPTAAVASSSPSATEASAAGLATPSPATPTPAGAAASSTQTAPGPGAPPFVAAFSQTDDINAWAAGRAPWNATVSFQHAPAGAALVLRIVASSPPGRYVAQSPVTPLNATDGTVGLTVPLSGALPAGNYVAQLSLVQNGVWTEAARHAIAVSAPAATQPATQQPTQQATQPPPQSATSPSGTALLNVAGSYALKDYIRYGSGAGQEFDWTVMLTQQGANVSGRAVSVSDSSSSLTLDGQLNAGILHFHYQGANRDGEFWWQFTPDGARFAGAFSALAGGSDVNGGTSYGVRQAAGGAAPAQATVFVVGANAVDGFVTRGQTAYVCYTASAASTITLTTTPAVAAAELTNQTEDGTGDCIPAVLTPGSDGYSRLNVAMKQNGSSVASGNAIVGFR
jgi:eukaryotic-like serine/threonine-protein kinase